MMGGLRPKLMAVAILAVSAGLAVFLFVFNTQRTISKPFAKISPIYSPTPYTLSPIPSEDADADGLTDQEETDTYGTNQTNPDTDSDGYMDGEEVAQNTNPLEKESYPNEPSIASLINEQNQNYSQAMIGTLLNDIAQNDRLFYTEATGSEAIQLHTEYNPDDLDRLAGAVTEDFLQSPDIVNLRPSDAEIIISASDSPDSVKEYLAQLHTVIANETAEKELTAFFNQMERELLSNSAALSPELKRQARTIIMPSLAIIEKQVRSLRVPNSWKELHKDEIAIIAGQKTAISFLASPENDPLRTMYALTLLSKVGDDWSAWKAQATTLLHS